MRSIHVRNTLLAVVLGVGLVGVAPSVAQAEKPVFSERYHETFSEVDEYLSAMCGFEILFSIDVRGHFREFADGSIKDTSRGSFTLSANDRSLTNSWAGLYTGRFTEEFGDDGLLTVTIDDSNRGLHEKWTSSDGGKPLIMDRGFADFHVVLVIDVEADEFVSETVTWTTKGPHPILDAGGLDESAVCGFLD